ncbi:GNAT family N-acetyltransferase [Paludibacterium paludis]|uniref:N-acetyltransferase domain-containing protein n=1 Tax=Paludibacterium paludis TaxID=1225769 RepID=A0A918U9Q7_9NEIS|nr:GNAT family N-acetyltransferase [Paludibacterium paludis]GGY13772.1 hypothetical protein GCM10011289_16400 [Paludibacterium paludis]
MQARVRSEPIEVRELQAGEIGGDFLDQFVRHQAVGLVYRGEKGNMRIEPAPFIDDWAPEERRMISAGMREAVSRGGYALGLFLHGKLAGFALLEAECIGDENEYALLKEFHVDSRYRGRGFGKRLFAECVARGRRMKAEKLYISSHSAIESVGFYLGRGCRSASWVYSPLREEEPFDCPLEYQLGGLEDASLGETGIPVVE